MRVAIDAYHASQAYGGIGRHVRELVPLLAAAWPADSFVLLALPALVWVEVQSPTVEIDGGAEVLPIAEASSRVRDPLDLGVDAFTDSVRDPVDKIAEDVRKRWRISGRFHYPSVQNSFGTISGNS